MKKVRLGDIATIYNGSTPSTTDKENFNGDIIWITPKDLSSHKEVYISKGERNITQKGLREIGSRILPKGTILLSSRAPIGLLAIANNPLTTNQGFKNIVCNNKLIDNLYLYYLLKTKINEIQSLGAGTTFKEVSKIVIENFSFSIHSNLSTQKCIAAILSTLDAKIALNQCINTTLEQMAKTVYDYWFVQFDFPHHGKPYKSSGGKMTYNDILRREIPEGWEVKKLENLFEFEKGIEAGSTEYLDYAPNKNYVKFYRVGDIDSESSIYIDTTKNCIDLQNLVIF